MVRRNSMRNVADFLRWEPLLARDNREALREVECPDKILGRRVPASLDGLTFEQLCRLWDVKTTRDLFLVASEVVLGIPASKVLRAPLLPFMGFVNKVASELERITNLWNDIPSSHTPEEIAAGCNQLNFGVFGIADWYCRRMGLNDHDRAMNTPWVRLYQCMLNDAKEAQYRKRLNEILNNKIKHK